MSKKRIKGPISKYEVPPLDEELYFKLYDILRDDIFGGNMSALARVLDIAIPTAKNWSVRPPKNRWINHTLTQAITEIYHSMTHSRHKKIRRRAERVAGQLHIAGLHSLKEYIEYNEVNNSTVLRELLVVMLRLPDEGITLNELKKPGYLGIYSKGAIRVAAQALGLVTTTTGFGKEKQVHYRLPTDDDI